MKNNNLGVMIDCSRNGVMNLPTLKKFIGIISKMGYNSLLLYTEDTYEIPDEPYFGYMRGRYTADEIKEIDCFCAQNGIELIPCIQTLAHFDAMVRWSAYWPFVDMGSILLAGDDRTYNLIDKMFDTLERNFTSRTVNIGMDEAHMLGRGKYADEHGFVERFEIMSNHLKRVAEIAERHGFHPIMWSDMFFRIANNGDYVPIKDSKSAKEISKLIPQNVGLTYWAYTSREKEIYDRMLDSHLELSSNIWFAGGLWSWEGFAPMNRFSCETTAAAMASCYSKNIKNIIFTMWGDNGKECSYFSLLPSLMYAAMAANGITDEKEIKNRFYEITGENFDEFMKADLPNYCLEKNTISNRSKYLFYNDYFIGLYDFKIGDDYEQKLRDSAAELKNAAVGEDYKYIFNYLSAFSDALALKCRISKKTRTLYHDGDKDGIRLLLKDYERMIVLLTDFYNKFRIVWEKENKPIGFEVQDIRIGGLIQRTNHCRERLEDYIDGKTAIIPELEGEALPDCNLSPNWDIMNDWGGTVTCCRL